MSKAYRYEIEPRPAAVGGGWRLRLFEGEKEVGGGVFPPFCLGPKCDDETASRFAHADAQKTGHVWLASKEKE